MLIYLSNVIQNPYWEEILKSAILELSNYSDFFWNPLSSFKITFMNYYAIKMKLSTEREISRYSPSPTYH